jgi:hypothetical protein
VASFWESERPSRAPQAAEGPGRLAADAIHALHQAQTYSAHEAARFACPRGRAPGDGSPLAGELRFRAQWIPATLAPAPPGRPYGPGGLPSGRPLVSATDRRPHAGITVGRSRMATTGHPAPHAGPTQDEALALYDDGRGWALALGDIVIVTTTFFDDGCPPPPPASRLQVLPALRPRAKNLYGSSGSYG